MSQTTVTRSGSANTLNSDTANSNVHEDLLNMFTNEDRSETPFVSLIGTSKASNVNHEWLVDNYADPKANAAAEGADFSAADASQTPRRRLGNYTQIFRATIAVSGTAQSVNTAGVASEFAHEIKKKVVELRRDIERQYVLGPKNASVTAATTAQQLAVVKDGAGTRHAGSVQGYAQTHVTMGGTLKAFDGSNTTGSTYTASTYKADGTDVIIADNAAVALTLPKITEMITTMYDNGGKPNVAMMGTGLKPVFSALLSGSGGSDKAFSQRRMSAMEAKLNIAVTSVMTDFGFDLALLPSYIMQNFSSSQNDILFVDTSMVKRAILRPIKTNTLDDGGDGKRALILCEETLEVRNPQSVGILHNAK